MKIFFFFVVTCKLSHRGNYNDIITSNLSFYFFLLYIYKIISLKINSVCFSQFTFGCCEESETVELSQAPPSPAKAAGSIPVSHQRPFCSAPKWPNNTWYCCWTKQGGELHHYLLCVHLKCLLSLNLDLYFLDYWNLVILNYVFFYALISFWSARKTCFTDKNPKGATSWNPSHTNGTPKGQKVSDCEWREREDQKTWVKAEWNSETKLFPG